MHLVSYAQNFEDIMLWRALGHVQGGCYVDVGAQSPDVDSVSRLFHERGWRGIHVEPTPDYAAQLRKARTGDLVIQTAIAAASGSLAFYEVAETGLSTSKRDIADKHILSGFTVNKTVVPAMTLDDLLANVDGPELHWLKIDVEGAEEDVIRGWSTSPLRPWVVVVESTLPLSQSESHSGWEPMLREKGYRFCYFDGLNRFYVSAAHEELIAAFACGPNVFDKFSLAASSVFCANVNIAYHALEQLHEREIQAQADARFESERQHLDRLHTLRQQHESLEHELGVLRQQHELREHEVGVLRQQHELREHEVGVLRQQHELREHEVGLELQSRDAEISRLAAQAQLEQARLSAVRDSHLAQIDRFQAHAGWLDSVVEGYRGDKQDAQAQTEKARHDAHRWWLSAEQLRRELRLMETSHSWRLTSPLRGARRLTGDLIRFPALTAKTLARPAVVRAMRFAISTPSVRIGALRLLESNPRLKTRFRNLALSTGLIEESREPSNVSQPRRMNIVRRRASRAVSSARAGNVLADLRRAIEEKQA